MPHHNLKVNKDGLEEAQKWGWDYPLAASKSGIKLSEFEGGRFELHWHADIEITLVQSGRMYYQANDRVFLLQAGDAVFVNSNVLHAGWLSESEDCVYRTLNFNTVMISGHENSRIEHRYVRPLLHGQRLPLLLMKGEDEAAAPLLLLLSEIFSLQTGGENGRELLVKAALLRLWYYLCQAADTAIDAPAEKGVAAVKQAIDYMEAQFSAKLTLLDIAHSCGLSRSEFCRVFHRFTGRTPFAYLQQLRVRHSLPLLESNVYSITEIAERCGFAGASYYAEIFRRFMGTSPLAYRKQHDKGAATAGT